MKTLNSLAGVLIFACLFLSSCFGPGPSPKKLRIKTMEWGGILYRAQYDPYGTLTQLKAADRDIHFSYDENQKLYSADIVLHGQSTPEAHLDFSQGPWGISKIRTSQASYADIAQPNRVDIINYLTPTKLSSFTYQEWGTDLDGNPYVVFELDRRFVYQGNNVARVYSVPTFTEFTGSEYDHKINPFMILADAVNNPAFFPLGGFSNFPGGSYSIPLISTFSENNPLKGVYQIVDAPITATTHAFSYTYDGNLVKKIVWNSTYLGDPTVINIFKFEYEWAICRPREHHGHE
ncbi:hypothetical protein [Chryseolinea lacunae]|uniref:Uncharacterized protein n=1 Tax=Chryseolinea lacunae TaxID=2801331 RepID=A0ABS1KMP0_9BACT|nr:hypothetical protein [Chryseolinea lacunae]MBL0740701.1 hypothetical protein [Chryseolinea lacunae]